MSNQTDRPFPIQAQRDARPHPMTIPWSIAELAYSVYVARYGRGQSLERLAERGGFGPGEMDSLLPGWRDRCNEFFALRARVKELEARIAELEGYLEKTADGVILQECDRFYCPKCGEEIPDRDLHHDIAYCWNCPSPDSCGESPLPLLYCGLLSNPLAVRVGAC